MTHEDWYLEWRLRLWGYYLERIKRGEEGWPSCSLIAVIMELGAYIPSGKPYEPPTNEMISEVNTWVNRLGVRFPHYAKALKCYYIPSPKKQSEMAKELGISLSTFKEWKDKGKLWIAGRLDAEAALSSSSLLSQKIKNEKTLTSRAIFG